jgi:SOS-response transcriptional repressor LexA
MFEILPRSPQTRVLMALASISCGDPAEICTELERVDLNEFVTNGESGVYLLRAKGDSMEAEIRRGDMLIVNTNLQAETGDAVVARVNGDYIVKDFTTNRGGLFLVPKNKKYDSIKVTAKDDYEIVGVVTGIVRGFKKN